MDAILSFFRTVVNLHPELQNYSIPISIVISIVEQIEFEMFRLDEINCSDITSVVCERLTLSKLIVEPFVNSYAPIAAMEYGVRVVNRCHECLQDHEYNEKCNKTNSIIIKTHAGIISVDEINVECKVIN